MRLLGIVLAILCLPSAAGAVVLNPGDIVSLDIGYGAILRVDPVTGDRSVVSGCDNFDPDGCGDEFGLSEPVGSGASFPVNISHGGVAVAPTGTIYVCTRGNTPDCFAIDPTTGNRTRLGTAGLTREQSIGLALVPESSGAAVSTLPTWGVWLLIGVLLGFGIKGVRRGPAVG
jgi:hypothetical protein